ncbi:hypothetical protein [Mesorhizobium sp. KR9-304]|uniref:hypothetical protein n=1 Tax=Mesorhizobium sp. KR9-304 TaxID=3156614 RepID=UPI0032B59B8F
MAAPIVPQETLLSASAVFLYGRMVGDLQLVADTELKQRPKRKGANLFLQSQLKAEKAGFARIYAFSYEGYIYDLAKPALFLVHGGGYEIDSPEPEDLEYQRLSRSPGRATWTGVGRQSGVFSLDMRVWVYDKGDFSMRLEVETGTFEDLLLVSELDEEAWGSGGRSGSGRSGSGRSGSGRSGSGRSGSGRSGSVMGRSGS